MKFRHFQLPGNIRGLIDSRIQPWHRYHGFLGIIMERYTAVAAQYDPSASAKVKGPRVYHVTEDPRQILQLNVETFYLYSNMLLDQIAANVRFYFGFLRGRKDKMNPKGKDWTHLDLLSKLEKSAALLGLVGDMPALLKQAEEFRRLRTYRNESVTHWDASDTHLATAWDGKDLTIQRGFIGSPAELQRQRAAGQFEFQMTVPLPVLYRLVDTYAATVQELLEANTAKFVGKD